ncbi:putative threonine-rich GPI-anchored glyco isoform X2 [Labeo rohita]|uniref:Putative threonine-rich GPI-anchored glyco isoform X2 n=1 Tax=Labeo rohita TaxID=84645 RepID=A0A498MWW6_LABRO|nr:putative threonine-rich GPI-anchored glyco isoform X2 [Labeo rohita]
MTSLRQQELAPVLLGYLKQRRASGSTCGSDTSSLSAWLEESFGKFSIYVDYKDLREINTGFDSFEALDLLSTSQVAQLTLGSGALNSAALINMVFERLENGNSFQNAEEFFVALTQTSQDLDINPVVRDIMMNRTFAIISLHFADFATDDWVSWFTVKLTLLLPSLTAEMLQTATSHTDCGEYHIIVGALSSVFDHMTSLRQQELAPVLLGYLKQRRASGSTCGSDTSSLSAWLEESFGKFSIYVDYKDLREINTGFDSFEALDLLSTSQVAQLTLGSGALNSAALINMVFERLENGNSFQNAEEFFVALTQTSQDLDINPVVRDIMMNRTFAIISLHFADFATDDWVSWFTVKLTLLLPSLTAEMLQTATSHTDCGEYHIIVGALSSVFDHMTSLRQQELAPVLLGYLKQRRASGSTCGSDTSSLSAWLEESFGKFSIYVDYKDLREINTGFDSFEALDLLSTSQVAQLTLGSGALNSAALINMVFERLENGNSFQNAEEFFVALTQTSQTATSHTDCGEYHIMYVALPNVGALSSVFDHMTSLRQQELAPVLLGYLKAETRLGLDLRVRHQQPQCLA